MTRIVTDGEGFYEVSYDRKVPNAAFGRPSEFANQTRELRVVVVRDVYPETCDEVYSCEACQTPRANLARGSEWVRLGDARVERMRDTSLVRNYGLGRGLLTAA